MPDQVIPASNQGCKYFSPDGQRFQYGLVIGWAISAEGAAPVCYPQPPDDWLIAVNAGRGVLLETGEQVSAEGLQARLKKDNLK
jgi:hypothetical protein